MMDDDGTDDDEDNGSNDDVDANGTGWVPRDARRSQERQGGRRMVRGQRVLVDKNEIGIKQHSNMLEKSVYLSE